jgi:hypothetical protein
MPTPPFQRANGGHIAATDGAHCADGGLAVERIEHQPFDRRVESLTFGDLHHRAPLPRRGRRISPRNPISRSSSPRKALPLNVTNM